MMTWMSFAVGSIMIFIMFFLGGRDIVHMAQDNKATAKKK